MSSKITKGVELFSGGSFEEEEKISIFTVTLC